MRPLRRWGAPPAVDLILGVVAVVPPRLSVMFAADHPLAEPGLTSGEPTDNDGMPPLGDAPGPGVGGLPRPVDPAEPAGPPGVVPPRRRHYWAASAGLVLVPMALPMVLFTLVDG
ncbi:hypothetical protein [Streptomyces sp. NPDC058625]|uniref:hypothetical protein n=1 Tax=Streptomyces sp. NPDC058625 TaxID=3346564 RepID=UPI00365A3769